jgi:hypothetical protein
MKLTKETGMKADIGKTRFDLLLPEFEEAVAKVLTMGAEKYGPNNWQQVDDGENRYYAALRRHLSAWRQGDKIDTESGLSHLAHVASNTMFLMYYDNEKSKRAL